MFNSTFLHCKTRKKMFFFKWCCKLFGSSNIYAVIQVHEDSGVDLYYTSLVEMIYWPKGFKTAVHFSNTHTTTCVTSGTTVPFLFRLKKRVAWIHLGAAPLLALAFDAASSIQDEVETAERRSAYLQSKSWPVNVLDFDGNKTLATNYEHLYAYMYNPNKHLGQLTVLPVTLFHNYISLEKSMPVKYFSLFSRASCLSGHSSKVQAVSSDLKHRF